MDVVRSSIESCLPAIPPTSIIQCQSAKLTYEINDSKRSPDVLIKAEPEQADQARIEAKSSSFTNRHGHHRPEYVRPLALSSPSLLSTPHLLTTIR